MKYNQKQTATLPTVMGVTFTHVTMATAVTTVMERIVLGRYKSPLTVFTPNTEQLIQSQHDEGFLRSLNAATVTVPDSVGIVRADWWRAAVTGRPWLIRERVTGVDLAENLLAEAVKRGWKVVLTGGMNTTAQVAVDRLKKRFSGLRIWWIPMGKVKIRNKKYEIRNTKREQNQDADMVEDEVSKQAVARINDIQPDIVLVGLGAPKQEWWVLRHQNELNTQVVMVVGGAVDMWAGSQPRAPKSFQSLGLEWLWRLAHEPWRIGRQLRLMKFVGLVMRGKV